MFPMLNLTLPEERRLLAAKLHGHAVHLVRFVSTLQSDTASGVIGSSLASGAIDVAHVGRRFVTEPTDERGQLLLDLLEQQFVALELLAESDLAQATIISPHRTRLLDLIADVSPSSQ